MPSFRSIHRPFTMMLKALGLSGILVVVVSSGLAEAADAAEKTANLAKYCRQIHGRTAFPTVDRRDDGLMCSRRTHRGRGLLHRKITAAEVCAAQHRTRRFRRKGKGLICITGGGHTSAAKSIDLKKHCRAKYGRTAFVTRRRTDDRPMCSIRTHRGRGLRHHLINLSSLCSSGGHRVLGSKLHCGGAAAGGAPPGGPGHSSSAPAIRGPLPIPRRKGGGKLTNADFRGCSVKRPKQKRKDILLGFLVKGAPTGWVYGTLQMPCPRLAGGRTVGFAEYCGKTQKKGVVFLGGQVPTCFGPPGRIASRRYPSPAEWKEALSGKNRIMWGRPMVLLGPCYWASGIAVKNYGNYVVVFKYAKRRLECFYFKKAQYTAAWKRTDVLGMKLRDEIGALEKQKAEMDKKVTDQEMEIVRLENTFLNSKEGKRAKTRIGLARARARKAHRDALNKYHKFLKDYAKQKDASTPDKQACCVYTAQDKVDARDAVTSATTRAWTVFENERKKIFEGSLNKSDPSKFDQYRKAVAELNKLKAARDKLAKKLKAAHQKEDKFPWDADD